MRTPKSQTPEEKQRLLNQQRQFEDRRVKKYMEEVAKREKLVDSNPPPHNYILTEEQLGPNQFNEFHAEDRDAAERTIHTRMKAFVIDTLQKIWQADPIQINAIVEASLKEITRSIEATQIFMAAYKRLEEKQLLNQTAGINEAKLELLNKLNSEQVADLYYYEDRNEILDGIKDYLQEFQLKAAPVIKGVKPNEDVSDILSEMLEIARKAKQRHRKVGDGAAKLGEESLISSETQENDILHLLTPNEKKRLLKLEKEFETLTNGESVMSETSSTTDTKKTSSSPSESEEEASLRLVQELLAADGKRIRKPTKRLTVDEFGRATDSYKFISPKLSAGYGTPSRLEEQSRDDDSGNESSSKRGKKPKFEG